MLIKKHIVISFCCLIFTWAVNAQNLMDTTYSSTYYQQKVTLFRLLPDTKKEIIFLGNSITDIGEWAEIWESARVKNRGISTDNTFGVLARLDEIVSSYPAKVFIMIGINDIARETPDSIIISNYKKIIITIKTASPRTKIFILSILPTNNDFTEYKRYQNKTAHIIAVNNALENYCKEDKMIYIDLYSLFSNEENKLSKLYTNDGVHINGAGYMKWKNILLERGYMK